MPLIIVHGAHQPGDLDDLSQVKYDDLAKDLRKAVASVEQLHLEPGQVSVTIPVSSCREPCIIANVEGLFLHAERTFGVRQLLASTIKNTIETWLLGIEKARRRRTGIEKIEVFVRRFDPSEDAFSTVDL